MKKKRIIISSLILLLFVSGLTIVKAQHSRGGGNRGPYSDKERGNQEMADQRSEDDVDTGVTKIVIAGDIKAAFEIYDRAKYDMMTKQMKVKNFYLDKNSSHVIIISLTNESSMKPVKNASIEVEVISPYVKNMKKTARAFEGSGMFHYTADFPMQLKGNYIVSTVISLDGKKIKAGTDFTLKGTANN